MIDAKKVFISYAWDTLDISDKVLRFSNYLREQGIDANIDQYEECPKEGWPLWMENQIDNSDYVLIVASKIYWDKLYQNLKGKGVSWEIGIIYQHLYDANGVSQKFIPICFEENDFQYIPTPIKKYTYYNISKQDSISKLVNRINGIQNTIKPPLGTIKQLPEKLRKNLFITSIINIPLWDKSNWMGAMFLYPPYNQQELMLGLLYEGSKSSVQEIFAEWQTYADINDSIDFKFIEGEIEELSTGYTCLIQPNFKSFSKKMKLLGVDCDESLIISISRFQRMCPKDNFKFFNIFKKYCESHKEVSIVPVVLKNNKLPFSLDNVEILDDYIIRTRNISFLNATDINKGDVEGCVIPKWRNFYNILHRDDE